MSPRKPKANPISLLLNVYKLCTKKKNSKAIKTPQDSDVRKNIDTITFSMSLEETCVSAKATFSGIPRETVSVGCQPRVLFVLKENELREDKEKEILSSSS